MDKVAHQAQRLKDRWTTRCRADVGAGQGKRRGAFSANGVGERASARGLAEARPAREGGREDGGARVIRYRRTAAKPMSLDDAVLELSNTDGSVMVFRDAASDGVSVLCRRPDGNFWLIEPDL